MSLTVLEGLETFWHPERSPHLASRVLETQLALLPFGSLFL